MYTMGWAHTFPRKSNNHSKFLLLFTPQIIERQPFVRGGVSKLLQEKGGLCIYGRHDKPGRILYVLGEAKVLVHFEVC